MLPETSMASSTVARCEARVMIAAGRATASSITVSEARNRIGGTWRRKPSPLPIACLTIGRLA